MNARPALKIRRATLKDAPALLQLEQQFPTDRMSARSVRHMLRSDSACVLVAAVRASVSGAVVVFFRRTSGVARIYSVVVDPACRGQGLGAKLVRAAERAARERACATMSLEVRQDNRAARAMYDKLGYRLHAELPEYYEDGAPGLRLRRSLR